MTTPPPAAAGDQGIDVLAVAVVFVTQATAVMAVVAQAQIVLFEHRHAVRVGVYLLQAEAVAPVAADAAQPVEGFLAVLRDPDEPQAGLDLGQQLDRALVHTALTRQTGLPSDTHCSVLQPGLGPGPGVCSTSAPLHSGLDTSPVPQLL